MSELDFFLSFFFLAVLFLNNFIIPSWAVDILGNKYLYECILILESIIRQIKLKNEKADYYREKLHNIDVVPPLVKNYNRHTFMLYSILTKNNSQRQKIITELNKKGIETRINFPPVHLQPVYVKRFNFKVDSLPITEDIANRILGLPIFIKMTNEQQDIITESIKRSIGN